MSCQQTRLRLSAYLDRELDPESRAAVEKHLAECRYCQEQYADLVRLDRSLRARPDLDPSADLAMSLMAKIKAGPFPVSEKKWGLGPVIRAFLEDFSETLWPMSKTPAGSLESFSDFPPCLLGRMYMKIIEEKV